MLFTIIFISLVLFACIFAVADCIVNDSVGKAECFGGAMLGVVCCVYLLLSIVF